MTRRDALAAAVIACYDRMHLRESIGARRLFEAVNEAWAVLDWGTK